MTDSESMDITGFKLKAALKRLQSEGYTVENITETCPPGQSKGRGDVRVVRQKLTGQQTIDLLVSDEEYPKEVK